MDLYYILILKPDIIVRLIYIAFVRLYQRRLVNY